MIDGYFGGNGGGRGGTCNSQSESRKVGGRYGSLNEARVVGGIGKKL